MYVVSVHDEMLIPLQTGHILESPSLNANKNEIGISELIHNGYITDAFPLHDVSCILSYIRNL